MGRVVVSGCFDNLHSGHIQFLQEAASYGDVLVVVARDETIEMLKGRKPFCSAKERLYCVQALCYVYDSCIAPDVGLMDFLPVLQKGDLFVVNEDGHSEQKQKLVEIAGATYKILQRTSKYIPRSTTLGLIPYRIEIAGAWLDQPSFRCGIPGMTITASIKPQLFFPRSGLAGSVRNVAMKLWRTIPDDYEEAAKLLFCASNSPDGPYVSGAQDAVGICYPGISVAYYEEAKWYPTRVDTITDPEIISFLENDISLFYLGERPKKWCLHIPFRIDKGLVKEFYQSTQEILIKIRNKEHLGYSLYEQRLHQELIFKDQLLSDKYFDVMNENISGNWKFNGAGGGGYAIVDSSDFIKFEVRT